MTNSHVYRSDILPCFPHSCRINLRHEAASPLPFISFFIELRYVKLGSRSGCHSVFIDLVSIKVAENLVYFR